MKTMKLTLVLFVALILVAVIPVAAQSTDSTFHNGSGLICNNCHTMHYSEGGQIPSQAEGYPQNAQTGGPFDYLLIRENITDLCLECHMNNQYAGAPSVYNTNPASDAVILPGGDFGYNASISTTSLPGTSPGGHNPYGSPTNPSVNFQPSPDGGVTGLFPPGNSTTMSSFQCTDCHTAVHGPLNAPHGAYPYRLLGTTINGLNTASVDSILSVAWVLSASSTIIAGTDGANLAMSIGSTNHNVYRGGFSEWCSACHPNFHSESNTDPWVWDATNSAFVRHPTNIIETQNITSGYKSGATYDYNYPLVIVNGTYQTYQTPGTLGSSDKIMCLSCHEAHGTAYPNALRWNPSVPSATTQCNKCHLFGGGV